MLLKKSPIAILVLGATAAMVFAGGQDGVEKTRRFRVVQTEGTNVSTAATASSEDSPPVLEAPADTEMLESPSDGDVLPGWLANNSTGELEDLGFRTRVCWWTKLGWICF